MAVFTYTTPTHPHGSEYEVSLLVMKSVWWLALLVSGVLSKPRCRCLHGQRCWPTEYDFAQLESTLSQPLIYPVPPESACYPESNPSGNCTEVRTNTFTGTWRSDQAGAMQAPNFETFIFPNGTIEACYLNTNLGIPCEQGSVPTIGVDARTVEDVQAAVKFAADHDLRVVVHNTGHDYLGRSTARGAFMIWTHHLKNITASPSFIPEGAPENETYNEAGVQWYEAYDAAHANGRVIVGGITPGASVGAAGGWMQGGGHSVISPQHGLGVDNVVQFEIVTASGENLKANSYLNSDLFWAVRGGGGGTYGVVTSVTYRTHDISPLTATSVFCNISSAVTKDVLTEYVKLWPGLSDAGWGAYLYLGMPGAVANFTILFAAPDVSLADANVTLAPFLDFVRNVQEDVVTQMIPFDGFNSFYQAFFGSLDPQEGINEELVTRLVSRETFDDHEHLVDVMMSMRPLLFFNVAGGKVSQIHPDSAGVNPAWRNANALMYSAAMWEEGVTVDEYRVIQEKLKNDLAVLESLAPGGGTYLNEASMYEPNPQHTFFGDHYERLKCIKDTYDPTGLFIVASGVGSEDWDSSLNCRRT
ncbi:hypothetical protein D9758_014858 [Tetrapyrgos nigripes]|uniref:FAD-binding PCMH-type domain-containing protein n=1 Tax=Tetrapyrgos nigripes TaxID=182062 RepID=A0A8H5CUN0_9AGAR|nr:hypothetical protein D9758_014858 [Tetrapyrgos nigripes]